MKLYISRVGALIGLVYLLGLVLFWPKLARGTGRRMVVFASAAMIGLGLLYWDVAITSLQMRKLCPTAGIALKHSVRTDGYLTNFGAGGEISRGFKFLEIRSDSLVRVYEKVDGAVQEIVIDTKKRAYIPRSRYEFVSGRVTPWEGLANVSSTRSEVRDRLSGQVIGTATRYTAYPGWVDRNTAGLIGKVFWFCPAEQDQDVRLMRAALLPIP